MTALPEPGWIDSGELAAVAHTLGVAHPTGSPLYVLCSRLIVLLLPGPFFPLVALSAAAAAAGIWMVARTRMLPGRAYGTAGAVAAVILALAPTLWSQATINEVYALQFLLFALYLHVWSRSAQRNGLFLQAYIAGLAFANHQSAIFLAPLLAARLWSARPWRGPLLYGIGGLALLGVSLYLALPLRSLSHPLLDWGNTGRLDGFLRHVTGWQYSGWIGAKSSSEFLAGLSALGSYIWQNFPWFAAALLPVGLGVLWKRARALLYVTLAGVLLCLAFGLNFPNPDVEAFYLFAFMLMALWAGAGAAWLWSRRRPLGYLLVAAAGVSLAYGVWQRYPLLNRSDFHVATDWVRDALLTVEPGAVVLTREWDHYAPWLYLRFVTGLREDVTWIDTELLRRSWYPEFIRRADPERYARARPALDRLAPQIARFESGSAYDPAQIERAYADAIFALSLGQPGPVYVDGVAASAQTWGVERVYLRGSREVPWGLLTRVFRPGDTIPPLPPWPDYSNARVAPSGEQRTDFHLSLYGRARQARAAAGR